MTSILMSPENPTGWKLEELLRAVATEVDGKTLKIARDSRPEARAVRQNNGQIAYLLRMAADYQDRSMETLATLGPNAGPTGVPRVGPGSPGFDTPLTAGELNP